MDKTSWIPSLFHEFNFEFQNKVDKNVIFLYRFSGLFFFSIIVHNKESERLEQISVRQKRHLHKKNESNPESLQKVWFNCGKCYKVK